MNAPEAIARILSETSADLAADNAKAAQVAEERFDATLKSYIENTGKQYEFGGIYNLLMTIGTIMADLSRLEGDDFEKAAEIIYDASSACDLKYSEPL